MPTGDATRCLMWVRSWVSPQGRLDRRAWTSSRSSTAAPTAVTASPARTTPARSRPITYKVPNYRFRGLRVFTNKPAVRAEARPRHAAAALCAGDPPRPGRRGPRSGSPWRYQHARFCVDEYTMTANHMRVTSCGLRRMPAAVSPTPPTSAGCSTGKLPYGKGIGVGHRRSYMSGAGLPIYWNNMPHHVGGPEGRPGWGSHAPSAWRSTSARVPTPSWR